MTRLRAPVRGFAGTLAAWLLIAACLAATAVTFTPPVAGPRHHCHGYNTFPPRHVMSDLRAGAITQQLPRCHLLRSR